LHEVGASCSFQFPHYLPVVLSDRCPTPLQHADVILIDFAALDLVNLEGSFRETHSGRMLTQLEVIHAAYIEYDSTDEVVRDLVDHLKETAMVERRQAVSNKRPDMEWYDERPK